MQVFSLPYVRYARYLRCAHAPEQVLSSLTYVRLHAFHARAQVLSTAWCEDSPFVNKRRSFGRGRGRGRGSGRGGRGGFARGGRGAASGQDEMVGGDGGVGARSPNFEGEPAL